MNQGHELPHVADQPDLLMDDKLEHVLAFFAKLLCSGVFVVGREAGEFVERDLKTHVRPEGMPLDWDDIAIDVNAATRRVTLSAHGVSRSAVFNDRQGCSIVPSGADGVFFRPTAITPEVPDPRTTPWPMGDLLPSDAPPAEVNEEALAAALELAFDDRRQPVPQETRAIVVVHRDRVIAERYAPGFDLNTRHVSWSMGKSITAALIGVLVGDGHFVTDDRAPIDEWRMAGDPRREITIAHLLWMSSGLRFVRAQDDGQLALGWTRHDDHMYIYYGGIDVFAHSVSRPLEYPPNTVWRYRNGDPLTLGKIICQTVERRGDSYLNFPQRALFDRIGMRNMVLETDAWGNFIMTGFDYGTPRDWARFGLLHLRDGVWNGERILPKGWVDFVRAPAPADKERHYGGQFWLNAGGRHARIPADAYWAAGAWGQVTMVISSRDVVVVRLGHSVHTGEPFDAYMNKTISDILDALPDE